MKVISIISILSSLTIVCEAGKPYAQYHFNCGEVLYTCGENIADKNVCPILGSDPREIYRGSKDTCQTLIEIARLPQDTIYRTKCPDGSTVISYNKYDDTGMDGRKCDTIDGCLGCWDPRVISKGGGISKDISFTISDDPNATGESVSEISATESGPDDTDGEKSNGGTASDYPSDFTTGTEVPIETWDDDGSTPSVGFRMNKLQVLEFTTFDKTIYNFTGQCDLTLASIPKYGEYEASFDLQARTTMDPKEGTTTVSSVVLKVGENIFELHDSGKVMFNQKNANKFPIVMDQNYTIIRELESFSDEKNEDEDMNITIYTSYLDSADVIKFMFFNDTIRVAIFADTLTADIASFKNKGGMLGVPGTVALTGRKGTEITPEDMGTEWQVQTANTSDVLFREMQDPQFPTQCFIPDLNKDTIKLTKKGGNGVEEVKKTNVSGDEKVIEESEQKKKEQDVKKEKNEKADETNKGKKDSKVKSTDTDEKKKESDDGKEKKKVQGKRRLRL